MNDVPVPHRCSTIYLVLTPHQVEDPQLTELPIPLEDVMRMRGASAEQIMRIRGRHHQTSIHYECTTAEAADKAFAARKEALELAEAHDGIAIDLLNSRVIDHPSTDTSLANASLWFVLEHDFDALQETSTHGLDQFGLPELRVHHVPVEHQPMYDALLTGIAHRLIAEWPDNDPIGPATITLRDIAYGYGQADAAQTPNDRSVDLTLTYDDEEYFLDVTLHDDPAVTLFAP